MWSIKYWLILVLILKEWFHYIWFLKFIKFPFKVIYILKLRLLFLLFEERDNRFGEVKCGCKWEPQKKKKIENNKKNWVSREARGREEGGSFMNNLFVLLLEYWAESGGVRISYHVHSLTAMPLLFSSHSHLPVWTLLSPLFFYLHTS